MRVFLGKNVHFGQSFYLGLRLQTRAAQLVLVMVWQSWDLGPRGKGAEHWQLLSYRGQGLREQETVVRGLLEAGLMQRQSSTGEETKGQGPQAAPSAGFGTGEDCGGSW